MQILSDHVPSLARACVRRGATVLASTAFLCLAVSGIADPGPTARLANISTRLAVGTGDNVLIAGFIVTGNAPKNIVVRGLGPTLPVIENLADTRLELYDSSGNLVSSNDNWRDTQENALEATAIPPTNDYESALLASVEPGAYTAVLSGLGGTRGIGVVELYDLDANSGSRLANISTRGVVGRGDDVLIGGTIVVGNGTSQVLFRALGPSLAGVSNALQDPVLELHDADGSVIAFNNNWEDSQAAEISAAGIPPPNQNESAIVRSLAPGAYTAVVRGNDATTGVALIEAYQLN